MGIICSELMTDEAFLEQELTGEVGGIFDHEYELKLIYFNER